MPSGALFDQILADKLDHTGQGTVPSPGRAGHGWLPHLSGPAVLFAISGTDTAAYSRPTTSRATTAYPPPPRSRRAASPSTEPGLSRRARRLNQRQQLALANLTRLGAGLGDNFTAQELKAVFRRLARVYHPDRHPDVSEFEKVRMARQFSQLYDAYHQLLKLDELPPAA